MRDKSSPDRPLDRTTDQQVSRLRQGKTTALPLMGQWAKVIQSRSITVGEPKSCGGGVAKCNSRQSNLAKKSGCNACQNTASAAQTLMRFADQNDRGTRRNDNQSGRN